MNTYVNFNNLVQDKKFTIYVVSFFYRGYEWRKEQFEEKEWNIMSDKKDTSSNSEI